MTTIDPQRRHFLGHATAVLAAAGVAPRLGAGEAAAATPERVVDRKSPAAASGTLKIGGDLEVARMGFGAMRITGDGIWGEPASQPTARAVLRRALELGVNFIDTADSYGPAVSERLIGEALHPYARGLLVATKGGLTRPGPNRWVPDCRPEHLRAACEGSLKRLKTERIDLYQLHTPDPKVPYADSLGELAKLQQEGKIRHIGISNVNVAQLEQARSLVKVVSVQNRYNVVDRGSEDVLQACEKAGIAFIPWGPLAKRPPSAGSAANASLTALEAIAKQRGIGMPQATLAWLLAHSPVMLPIPGTGSIDHLEENVAAAKLRFTAEEMKRIG
jgi:aryl-alcohol dehydrogenase-like predicted oxidoreductase